MNQPSAFQLQYPLSPRKFWKKMLNSAGSNTFLFGTPLGVAMFFYAGMSQVFGDANNALSVHDIVLRLVLMLVVAFICGNIIYAVYIKAYIKRYYYDCGEQFITIKKRVFAPTEIHVQYQKIQDVYVDQDIMDRILGIYDVHIASATVTSGIEAHIDGVSSDVAENLKNIILEKIHGISNSVPQASSPGPSSVEFNQKISSENYPIMGSWLLVAIANSFTIVVFLFLIGYKLFYYLSLNHEIIVLLVVFLLLIIRQIIWKSNYYFEFNKDYILLRTGVLGRSENHVPYKSIQNIINKQGFIEKILGLSTITIQNAAVSEGGFSNNVDLVGQPKVKAEELNKILNDIVVKINPQSSSAMGV